MKHFIATIRHHRFRLEQLPLSFAVVLARNRPQPAIAVGAVGICGWIEAASWRRFPSLTFIQASNIEGRLAQVGEAFSLCGGRTTAYHAFTGWESYFASMRQFVKSTGLFPSGETERIGRPS
jgi:hypothetical protein